MPPKRLFTAIEMPEVVGSELIRLGTHIPGVRWHPPEKLHLTLAFFGDDVPPAVQGRLMETLPLVRRTPFFLRLGVAGHFGGERPRALVVGADAQNPDLAALHRAVGDAVRAAGVENVRREFVPHVTVAYAGRDTPAEAVRRWEHMHAGFDAGVMRVDGFALFASAGGVYSREGSVSWPD